MEPITAQEIVDLLEARYAELQAQRDKSEELGLTAPSGTLSVAHLTTRMQELETVLHRIDTYRPPQVESGSEEEAQMMLRSAEEVFGMPIEFVKGDE